MMLYSKLVAFRYKQIVPSIQRLLSWTDRYICLMSFVFLLTKVYQFGFPVDAGAVQALGEVQHWTWVSYLTVNTLHWVLNFNEVRRNYRKITWILNLLLYLTLLPAFFPDAFPTVFGWFGHSIYHSVLLILLSLLNLSNAFVRVLGKKTNPSLILASSFLILILSGTGLLMLPKSTYQGISFIDALFTSTSAVCVTGLTTVDVSTVFTVTGQLVILFLIQIGGLGVMTITSFFAMFFMGNTSLYNQLAVKDMVSSQSLNSLLSTLLYILGFTLVIEAVGALFLYLDIHGTMGMTVGQELFFVVFHSISAFCNAGFSTLSGNLGNELLLQHHTAFYVSISLLVILGGIGYPILVNFFQTLAYEGKRLYQLHIGKKRVPHKVHLYNLNTRIAVGMTAALIVVGTGYILLAEWNGAFAGMSFVDKVVQAFFNAVSPRTAGFNSVSLTTMGLHTILVYMLLMVIGGGTQSTAGGVKVNVFAVVLLNLRAVMRNEDSVTIFNRRLSQDSIRRSNATFIFYLSIVFISFFLITALEPELPTLALLFECISALSTVGSSLDLTALLGTPSKYLLVLLMFVGRVGMLTFVASLIGVPKEKRYRYPSDQIIIN